MSVDFKRIILRNDKKNLGIPALQVGEPYFVSDTGELIFKTSEGSYVTLKTLSKGEVFYEHLSDDLQSKLRTLEDQFSEVSNHGYIDDFEYNSNTGELQFYSNNSAVGDVIKIATSSQSGGLSFDGGYVDEENKLHLTTDGVDVDGFDPILLPAGGGSGGSTGSKLTFSLTSGKTMSVADTATECNITFNFTSVDVETKEDTGDASLQVLVGGVVKRTLTVKQGLNSFNIMPYLQLGENSVSLVITDGYGATATRTCTIHREALTLSWNLGATEINTETLSLQMTPTGTGDKTIVVLVDGKIYSTNTTANNRRFAVNISGLTDGAHKIEAYCKVDLDGVELVSDTLTSVIAQTSSEYDKCIIVANCNISEIEQYTSLSIPYRVVDNNNPTDVQLIVNGEVVESSKVDQTEQLWTYRPSTVGAIKLEIVSGSTRWSQSINVKSLSVDVDEITDNLAYKFDPNRLTNLKEVILSDNFDLVNGGLVTDSDGIRCFKVMKGDRAKFPVSFFSDDSKQNGKTIKFIYKIENCSDFETTAIECFSNNIGIKISANSLLFKSEQQSVEMQTCEGYKSEIDFVVQPSTNRLTIYEDSIPAQTKQFASSDNFTQSSPQTVTIGSDDCNVLVYLIRYYSAELADNEILTNYIYDGKDGTEIQSRFNRSQIYDSAGNISPEKCAELNPDAHILIWQAPNISISKSNKVKGNLRHIYVNGGAGHNWTAHDVTDKVQGTSSARYVNAGLNQDFSCDNGFVLDDGSTVTDYAMTSESIPVHYFNMKVNTASSEHINNILLAHWFNKFQPYKRPARISDPRVRDTVEGHMAMLFYQNTGTEAVNLGAISVPPGKTVLYGLGCLNNSKKNYEVFGHNDTDDVAVIELNNNTSDNNLFKSDDMTSETWDDDGSYSWRYLSDKVDEADIKAKWQKFVSFVVACNPEKATGEVLSTPVELNKITYKSDTAEYRKAKFYCEFSNYAILDSVMYHYLFTLMFTMVDNRAKNTFWGYSAVTDRWHLCYGYDFDTAMGNDNEGALALRYGFLDTDRKGSRDVFNAADSVVYKLLRECFSKELKDMYIKLENDGCWDLNVFSNLCDEYQNMICPVLWIEDAYRKYISPLEIGDSSYLQMLNGKKRLQRRQFLTFQRQFISSYFRGAYTQSDLATLRGYTPSDWQGVEPKCEFTIVPYCDMFVNIDVGSESKSVRAYAGQQVTLNFTAIGTLNNTEIYFYNAQYLQDIGDISCIYPGYCSLAQLKRLKRAVIGSSATGYNNTNLTSIDVTNCESLEELNVENCTSFNQTLDLSNNIMLKKIYTRGSNTTGVTFATGCRLTEAYLNAITALRVKGLCYLKTLTVSDYSNLTTLVIDDSPAVDVGQMCNLATNLVYVSLKNINLALQNSSLLMRLSKLKGIDDNGYLSDAPIVTGTAELQGMSEYCREVIEKIFPNLTLQVLSILASYSVKFMYDKNTQYGDTQIVEEGSNAVIPSVNPTKAKTPSTVYNFVGWEDGYNNVNSDKSILASWLESTRRYVMSWHDRNGSIVQKQNIGYGEVVAYTGEDLESPNNYLWTGWDWKDWSVASENIKEDTTDLNVNATYDEIILPPVRDLENYDYLHSDDFRDTSAYTLGELVAVANAHLAEDYGFSVGDKIKIIPLPKSGITDESIVMRIERFNDRRLEDGGEKDAPHSDGDYSDFANISFGMIGVLNTARGMNSTNTNIGGFASSSVLKYLNSTVYNSLPVGWRSIIKPVQVWTTAGNSSTDLVKSICKMRLYNATEVGWSSNAPYITELDSARQDDGGYIMPYYRKNTKVKRMYNGSGDAQNYWTASPAAGSASSFCIVNINGGSYSYGAASGFSLACCFSL